MPYELFSWVAVTLSCAALLASAYIVWFALHGIRLQSLAPADLSGTPSSHFLILIPAHNESVGVRPSILSSLRGSYPAHLCRTIVIADNCDDDTAAISSAAGAEVWVRTAPDQRGKGQALAWAFDRARDLKFDMGVILDADSELDAEFLSRMDAAFKNAVARGEKRIVLQGRYDFQSRDTDLQWFEQLTIASKAAENLFTYAPRSAFQLVNLIQGNGFAVSREALLRVPFKATSVVEDAEYAISLALNGVAVRYIGDARVASRMTARIKDAAPQRLRWANGMFQLMRHTIPRLILGAFRQRDWRLAEAAVMLLFTSRMAVIYITLAAAIALVGSRGMYALLAAGILLLACALQSIYLGLIVYRTGGRQMSVPSLLLTPAYLGLVGLAQLGAALGMKRKQWNRTVR